MKRLGLRFIPLLWLPLAAFLPGASAATLTLQAVADTSLFEGNPDFNLGSTTLVAGMNQEYERARAMFLFDLGGIPAGAVVTEARVSLYVSRRPDPDQHGGPVDSDFSLHRLFVSWGEGSGGNATGSVAMAGDATWNQRHAGGISWANPGGQPGVDYASDPSATTAVSGVGGYLWGSTAGLVSDVQGWLAAPSSNFGFMLISQSENTLGSGRRLGSSEQTGGLVTMPQLMVTYDPVPEPSVAGLWLIAWAGLLLTRKRRPSR